jgi:ribosome biogenesis GTPase
LKGKTSVLVGYSGVGKSSLLNALEPDLALKVEEVSRKTGRGRHTTVSVKLLPLSFGGYVADTPGIREFGLWRVRPWELPRLFRDLFEIAHGCRYPGCFHIREGDCAVKQALAEGRLDPVRYKNYLRITESLTGKRRR